MQVQDVSAHSAMARMSNLMTLYLEVTGSAAGEKFHVALPVTEGRKGNLGPGKRGVFFDIAGREYEARIISLIENPISASEAPTAPFTAVWRFLVGKIESVSTSAEKTLEKQAGKALKTASSATRPAGAAGANPAGMLMGVGVAVAALSSAFAYIVSTISGMAPYKVVLGVVAAVLVILLPVGVVAMMKLRRQDLSSLLEGCGWAINAGMRLTRHQRRQFTRRVPYPPDARGTPRGLWRRLIILLVCGAVVIAAGYHAARHIAARASREPVSSPPLPREHRPPAPSAPAEPVPAEPAPALTGASLEEAPGGPE